MQVKNYEEILWNEPVKKLYPSHKCKKCKTNTQNYWFCNWCLSQVVDLEVYNMSTPTSAPGSED